MPTIRYAVAALLMAAASLAWAGPPRAPAPTTLRRAADAVEDAMRTTDAAVAATATDLGRVGVAGHKARVRLATLCDRVREAVACTATDAKGALVAAAPANFEGFEGVDLGQQRAMALFPEARRATLTDVYTDANGVRLVAVRRPVFGRGGRFLGSTAALVRPAALIWRAVEPVLTGDDRLYVVQKDGDILYAPQGADIGRDLLIDPAYSGDADLLAFAHRVAAEPEGTGEARLPGAPGAGPAAWTTVRLHDTDWRVVLAEPVQGGARPVAGGEGPRLPQGAQVGLDSLVALTEGHLTKIADDLALVAAGDDFRSGAWARIRDPLRRVGDVNVPAVYWYARTSGEYWTTEGGRAERTLADRRYFQRALQGETAIGELVVSRSTGRNVAVVAVPVKDADGRVMGVTGASVQLDALSERLRDEMGLPKDVIFYAFDADDRIAIHTEPEKVFVRAGELGPEVERAFAEIKDQGEGTIRYTLDDQPRNLVYRRSRVTGWWFAFGVIGGPPTRG